MVGATALTVDPQRIADRGGANDHREPGEPEREAVEADVVGDAEIAEPALLIPELKAPVEIEAAEHDRPEGDLGERDEQGERAGDSARQRQQPDDERSSERKEDQRGRHWTVMKTTMSTATAAAIARA